MDSESSFICSFTNVHWLGRIAMLRGASNLSVMIPILSVVFQNYVSEEVTFFTSLYINNNTCCVFTCGRLDLWTFLPQPVGSHHFWTPTFTMKPLPRSSAKLLNTTSPKFAPATSGPLTQGFSHTATIELARNVSFPLCSVSTLVLFEWSSRVHSWQWTHFTPDVSTSFHFAVPFGSCIPSIFLLGHLEALQQELQVHLLLASTVRFDV